MFYDKFCEPFFNMYLPGLLGLKSRLFPVSTAFGVLVVDLIMTGAFIAYCAFQSKFHFAVASGVVFATKPFC